MLAVAGILAQEIVRPDIFWSVLDLMDAQIHSFHCKFVHMAIASNLRIMRRYDAPVKIQLPFNIIGLVAFELFAMHFVETKRGYDLRNPGSQVGEQIATSQLSIADHSQCLAEGKAMAIAYLSNMQALNLSTLIKMRCAHCAVS